jgi:hypothetical protein
MPDSQIENAGVAAVFTRRRLRNITLAFTIDPQVHHRVVDEKFVQRNLAMYQGLNLETHCEFVDLQEWWLVGASFVSCTIVRSAYSWKLRLFRNRYPPTAPAKTKTARTANVQPIVRRHGITSPKRPDLK